MKVLNGEDFPESFYIYVRSCPRRSLDATKLYRYFIQNGLKPAGNINTADLIVVYTCGGFKKAEENSILSIEASLKKNAEVIITGCLPKIDPSTMSSYQSARIINVENLDQLDPLINAKFSYKTMPNQPVVFGVHDLLNGSFLNRLKQNFKFSREFLKLGSQFVERKIFGLPFESSFTKSYKLEIARGCLSNCSYCAIKIAMEKFHSFPEEQIIESFQSGLKAGYSSFEAIAGDIGCYGLDIKTNLPNLLEKLFSIEGNYKFNLIDLNPRWLKDYYVDLFRVLKANTSKVSKIIMPIQSGSNRILKLMNRGYMIDEVKKYLLDLHENFPSIELETHIMVGFPGEDSEDFQKSVALVKESRFAKIQIYKYEDRPGTASSEMPEKVLDPTIRKREEIIASLTHRAR